MIRLGLGVLQYSCHYVNERELTSYSCQYVNERSAQKLEYRLKCEIRIGDISHTDEGFLKIMD